MRTSCYLMGRDCVFQWIQNKARQGDGGSLESAAICVVMSERSENIGHGHEDGQAVMLYLEVI